VIDEILNEREGGKSVSLTHKNDDDYCYRKRSKIAVTKNVGQNNDDIIIGIQ